MRDVTFVLFLAAALSVFAGMFWGVQMAASEDRQLAPAHAHLNLVGWATLASFGIYYRLTPAANGTTLSRIHAGMAILGVLVLVSSIANAGQAGKPAFAAVGSILSVVSMAILLVTVVRHGFGVRALF